MKFANRRQVSLHVESEKRLQKKPLKIQKKRQSRLKKYKKRNCQIFEAFFRFKKQRSQSDDDN